MNKPVKTNIDTQGAAIINDGFVIAEGENIVAFEIDLKSKHAFVSGQGANCNNFPCLYIGAYEDTLHINKDVNLNMWTEISFPEYQGWTVWCADLAKYTLTICLVNVSAILEQYHDRSSLI